MNHSMNQAHPPRTTIRKLLAFIIIIPFLCLLIVALVAYSTSDTVAASAGWVAQTLEVKQTLTELSSCVVDTETSERGYLLTRRETDLVPYRAALQKLPRIELRLGQLIEDSRHDRNEFDRLEILIASKLSEVAEAVALVRAGKEPEAMMAARAEAGKSTMERIRSLIRGMQAREDVLLALREETAEAHSELARSLSFATVCLDVLIILLLVLMLARMQRLQNLVTVCAWTKAIRHEDRWMTFEEYLKERFDVTVTHGISEEAVAQLQKDVDAAHPKKH